MTNKSKWLVGAVVAVVLLLGAVLLNNSSLLKGDIGASNIVPFKPVAVGFTEIKVVESQVTNVIDATKKPYMYSNEAVCPAGYKIISGYCDPQGSYYFYPLNNYLSTDKNKFSCIYMSDSDAVGSLRAMAVCVK